MTAFTAAARPKPRNSKVSQGFVSKCLSSQDPTRRLMITATPISSPRLLSFRSSYAPFDFAMFPAESNLPCQHTERRMDTHLRSVSEINRIPSAVANAFRTAVADKESKGKAVIRNS